MAQKNEVAYVRAKLPPYTTDIHLAAGEVVRLTLHFKPRLAKSLRIEGDIESISGTLRGNGRYDVAVSGAFNPATNTGTPVAILLKHDHRPQLEVLCPPGIRIHTDRPVDIKLPSDTTDIYVDAGEEVLITLEYTEKPVDILHVEGDTIGVCGTPGSNGRYDVAVGFDPLGPSQVATLLRKPVRKLIIRCPMGRAIHMTKVPDMVVQEEDRHLEEVGAP